MNSDSNSRTTALASLTATYTDSEGEEANSDIELDEKQDKSSTAPSIDSSPSSDDRGSLTGRDRSLSKLVSYTSENYEDDYHINSGGNSPISDYETLDDSNDSRSNVHTTNPSLSPISFHRSLMSSKKHEIKIPPDPTGRCSKSLQEKISELYDKKKLGKDMNASIQQKKNFRNPSIYEKLITYCNIDEQGTNYPPEIYDPHCWGPESFYEELAKCQKEEMDKREKERKERTKVEFISGTAKKVSDSLPEAAKRKSKWDVGMAQMPISALKPATLITPQVLPVPTGTKPTVISAFGTIAKKPKQ